MLDDLLTEIEADTREPMPDFMSGEMSFVSFAHLEAERESQHRKAFFLSSNVADLAQNLSDIDAMASIYEIKINEYNQK